MSTNYYVTTDNIITKTCDCGFQHKVNEVLHIGLYSYGWMFSLHIIPEKNINELEDWIPILKKGIIKDEYGNIISYDDMLNIIKNPPFNQDNVIWKAHDVSVNLENNLFFNTNDPFGKDGNYTLVDRVFS